MRDRGMQVLDHLDDGDDVEGAVRMRDDARRRRESLERDAASGEQLGDLSVREVDLAGADVDATARTVGRSSPSTARKLPAPQPKSRTAAPSGIRRATCANFRRCQNRWIGEPSRIAV